MPGGDLFDFYRQVLLIVAGTYTVLQTTNFVLRWRMATTAAGRTEALARRYLVVQLLRVRLRRFAFDFLQLAVLIGVLAYLLWLHWH